MPTAMRPPLPHAETLAAPPRRRTDRPPLRRSIRLEEDTDGAAEERRRLFHRTPHQLSFDEGDALEDEPEHTCDCQHSSLERHASVETMTSHEEPELSPPPAVNFTTPPPVMPPTVLPYRSHLRGVSSDRVLNDRRDTGSPARALSHGVFERRMPRICKFAFIDKNKRASSSALYEQQKYRERSPTEAFYNATGSTRLSSQELFEKFCSAEFTSLYGREDDERPRRAAHSKSTGSSGSDVRACCRRRFMCRGSRSDRSTDSEEQQSPATQLHHSDEFRGEHSKSVPLLSPDQFDVRFTFDISEHSSEAPSAHDETPSDATETRNLTLYDEPYSDRTSLFDLHDAAFLSRGPSFRRDSARKRQNEPTFDLSALDFRAIDDESPSQHSFDETTLRQNSESRSWASDSVFTTPERKTESMRTESAAAESTTAAESTVIEEELPSVIERSNCYLTVPVGDCESEGRNGNVEVIHRTSMQRLEPLQITEPDADEEIRKVRRRRTRCFPL